MSLLDTEAGRQVFKIFAESEAATKFLENYEEVQKDVRKREGRNSITEEVNRNTRDNILIHRAES